MHSSGVMSKGAFDNALEYVHERKQFGKRIADFQVSRRLNFLRAQGVQFQLAQAYADIASARLHVYTAARMKEAGENCAVAASIAKLKASHVHCLKCDLTHTRLLRVWPPKPLTGWVVLDSREITWRRSSTGCTRIFCEFTMQRREDWKDL